MEPKVLRSIVVFFFLFILSFPSIPSTLAQRPTPKRRIIKLPLGVVGPETTAFDCRGHGPYVGVADGRILRWDRSRLTWREFATVVPQRSETCNHPSTRNEASCGRPLGLKFHPITCELYIADAYFGIMKVGRRGGVAKPVISHVNGVPMKFTNALDIDHVTGAIYFTDTSMLYSRWQWERVISTGDRTGRLLRYDPKDGGVTVLLDGLAFPNGVALSKDRSFLLVAETTPGQIQKYWLSGPRRHTREQFAQLGGRPDNVNLNADGSFWIAQNPTLPNVIAGLTRDRGSPVKMDSSGRILRILDNAGPTSDVKEMNNRVLLGSVINSYVTVIRS